MNKCIVCQSNNTPALYDGIMKCVECSHVFADLSLSNDELGNIYRKNYFFGGEYSDYVADKSVLEINFKLRQKILNRFIDKSKHRNLMEVGCAYGFYLNIAREYFETVKGIDISEDGIGYAKDELKLDVKRIDLLNYDFGSNKIDVACMWDTIEHLRSPHLYVEKLSQNLNPGGLIAITTGDIESINAKIKKENWRLIHPPTHLHYFSKTSLVTLLEKNGFEVIYNRYCGFFRSIDMVAYRLLVIERNHKKFYELLQKIGITSYNFLS